MIQAQQAQASGAATGPQMMAPPMMSMMFGQGMPQMPFPGQAQQPSGKQN